MKTSMKPKVKTKPRPCPHCKKPNPIFWELPGVYWIQCSECNTTTTMEDDRYRVLKLWNAGKIKSYPN